MARGTDWEGLAILGVGAVVVYEVFARRTAKPVAPAAPSLYGGGSSPLAGGGTSRYGTGAASSPAASTVTSGAAQLETAPQQWLAAPATSTTAYVATPTAAARTSTTSTQGTITFPATATSPARTVSIPASQALPLLPSGQTVAQFLSGQPATQVSTAPAVNNYQDLARFQEQISQSTYQAPEPQPAPAQTYVAPVVNNAQDLAVFQSTIQASLPTEVTQPIPQAQPADEPVYTLPEFSDEPVDYGDPTQFRRGGE